MGYVLYPGVPIGPRVRVGNSLYLDPFYIVYLNDFDTRSLFL